MAEVTFYRCDKCGELVMEIEKGHCVPQCCGTEMRALRPGTTDGAAEKHVPAIERADGQIKVKVGEVAHPMLEEHSIQWIALVGNDRLEIRCLHPGEAPEAVFVDDGFEGAAYEYCNLHGLWKTEF